MFLMAGTKVYSAVDLLHACGDVSVIPRPPIPHPPSAPRMWRCFRHGRFQSQKEGICSTHVEMFPRQYELVAPRLNLLHACGDVSYTCNRVMGGDESAPRMWRCFYAS